MNDVQDLLTAAQSRVSRTSLENRPQLDKRRGRRRAGIVLAALIVLAGAAVFIGFRLFAPPLIDTAVNRNTFRALPISRDIYYRQTLNNCAPYSVMAVINILQGRSVNPEKLAAETTFRGAKNLTYPQGVVDLLRKYGVPAVEYKLTKYGDAEKLHWIKNTIDRGRPIIFLVRLPRVGHYLTVLGYDAGGFLLYDSLQDKSRGNPRKTIDDRKEYPGNRYYTYREFLDLWNRGGSGPLYKNWAVACGDAKPEGAL